MPKVNVYLSDDLAAAVKAAGIPVSTVCQRALEDALRFATALREGSSDPSPLGAEHGAGFTARLASALTHAFNRPGEGQAVTTAHLALGLLDEGENLAVRILSTLDIEADDLRVELEAATGSEPEADAAAAELPQLDDSGREVLRLMGEEAVRLGSNFVGCEHLLLGIVAEPAGAGGRVLRSMGVEVTVARRAVKTALAGFVHARTKDGASSANLDRVVERLDRIEAALAGLGATPTGTATGHPSPPA